MKYNSLILVALVLIIIGASTLADSWRLPEKAKYYSPDKKYRFEVIPKELESQLKYFKDKVEGKENVGALQGGKKDRPKGIFYTRNAMGIYSKKSEFPLVNEVSPVSAIVSNKGEFVVTFDNWHSIGYGDDVVVIYRADGTLIKKIGLEDLLTEGDIETIPESTSSRRWGQGHYIDEDKGLLILRVVANRKSPGEEGAKFHELRIELATGRPLEPKRDLFPQPYVISSPAVESAADSSKVTPRCSSPQESFDLPNAIRIPSEQIYAKAKERPLPRYPPIAKAAHAEGTVIVEILVSKTGDALCARSINGHPLLKEAAVSAALNWKFEPLEVSGNTTKFISTVAFVFKFPM